jgi:catechol 2,3-dioxygenase
MIQLPQALSMGAVTLKVADLDRMLRYYSEGIGLKVLDSSVNGYALGEDEPVLFLEHSPNLRQAGEHEAGLFHTAFLFKSEASLAFAVASVASKYQGSFTGSADHLVSKAFYFDDPEGNGVELYWDRPRDQWQWQNGEVKMATLALDPNRFLADHLEGANHEVSSIGHVHLSVGSIEQAKDFYVNTLGFDITTNYANTALFVAAGGYHHHMAMNIWRSRGAGRRQPTLGLGEVRIELGSQEVFAELDGYLKDSKAKFSNDGKSIEIFDPWGNLVSIRA